MNCKPGQLAYLTDNIDIKTTAGGKWETAVAAGKIVKTVALVSNGKEWLIEDPISINMLLSDGKRFIGKLVSINDSILKPILPPDSELNDIIKEIEQENIEIAVCDG